ncbi:MAG: YgiT-type zinc finger protein [Chloroflexi bacterium]|nr:YgiT-type zinc finger protein [Chloroflexota bacterium]
MSSEFGYQCDYCSGIVRPKRVEREAFKHKNGFVILEDLVIGVCDTCGTRYFAAETIKRMHDVATGKVEPERQESVPVAHAS